MLHIRIYFQYRVIAIKNSQHNSQSSSIISKTCNTWKGIGMTDQIPADTITQCCLSEVYCSDLSSSCNIHTSGKSLCTRQGITKTQTDDDNNIKSSTAIMRYATEYHAITISQKNNVKSRGDTYHLSEHQLPVPASSDTKKKDNTKITSEDNNVDDVCIAHSSVCWGDDTDTVGSMDVFAMMRNSTVLNLENNNDNSTIDNNSLTTATLADERQESAVITSGDTTILSDTTDTPPAVSKNTDSKSTSSTYYLITKSRGTNSNNIENIPLPYRPLSIHATELHVTTNNSGADTSVIGIFVSSVIDNRLHLYVTSKDILQQKKSTNEHSFVQISLNDTTTLDSDVPAEYDLEDEGDTTNDPFLFSSPIMTMDTCITEEECSEESDTKVNRLALACYDGRVRILTYQLKAAATTKQEEKDNSIIDVSSLEVCHKRCSSFLVDGPISSLHFSLTARSSNPKLPRSLFLVAGSLCGFACTFYESTLTCSNNSCSQESFFNGPTLVVDGLCNSKEDCEDSVTSVHAYSLADGQQMIVVGTQGGRILLFGQCLKEKARWEDKLIRARQDKDNLLDQIDQKEKEILKLQSENELMDINSIGITASISKMQIEIDELESAAAQTTTIEDIAADSSDIKNAEQGSGDSIEEKSEPTNGEDEADLDIHEMSSLQTKMEEAREKLSSLQQDMKDNTLKITSLTTDINTLRSKSKVYERRVIDSILHPGLHRYRFLYEYHLPYPIHGITSSKSSDEHNGGRDIFVSTRRSFHVFSSTNT